MAEVKISPAEQAAIECMEKVMDSLASGNNFRVEAGAGAGKTYTLIQVLRFLIDKYGIQYQRNNKRIACITYTNVAKEEIQSRTDNDPVVMAETIHAFCWEMLKSFQKSLRALLPGLTDRWSQRCQEIEVLNQQVNYNLGYPKLTETEAFLHHDDVIKLMSKLLDDAKFRDILKMRFPIILIDEYQDTSKILAESISRNFLLPMEGPQIGLFGDHWQKIYGSSSVGLIDAPNDKLNVIGKNANFRSDRLIVEALNRIRVDLPQNVSDPNSEGRINIFDSNAYNGARRTENHWQEDLPAVEAHNFFVKVREILTNSGWDFDPKKTKILMLTNNLLATEQGYPNLLKAFSDSDDLMKKNDNYISFLSDVIDPAISSFENGKFGDMFKYLDLKTPKIKVHGDKKAWYDHFQSLSEIAKEKTIGDMIEAIKNSKIIRLPERIFESEQKLSTLLFEPAENRTDEDVEFITKKLMLRSVLFSEIIAFGKYIDDKTPFSTKHGVKGAQFENVMVVLGRGWNQYNWNQMLEWAQGVPKDKIDSYERNRNLFYVVCSRPRKRLSLVFTQKLSEKALDTLEKWFDVKTEAIPF